MKQLKTIVTTSWDDGHKLDIKLASLLAKYGIKGTFYLSPKDHEFNKDDLLTNKQIRSLSKNFEIGAHTMTHPNLTKIYIDKSEMEIKESKKYLEKIIARKITAFCYPYGSYNQDIGKLVKKNGFLLSRTTKRYSFINSRSPFELHTTFHAYNHFTDIYKIFEFSRFNLFKLFRYTNWEYLAIDLFEKTLKNKSIFHLWGHSWEIEKFNNWNKLERVLEYISNKKNVLYVTNSELI